MRVITSFLVGLVTNHLGTKALSLILSILVFAFVQNTLTGTRTLSELVLRFELSTELTKDYVLLQDTVKVPDVRIQGLRRIVDPLAKELRNGRRVVLTDAFLNRHGRPNLVIKPSVLRDILGETELEVSMGTADTTVPVDPLVTREGVLVQIAPDAETTPPDLYRGTHPSGNIDPVLNVKRVRLLGPASEMPDRPALFVDIHLSDFFSKSGFELTEERENVPLPSPYISIDWDQSGIRQEMVKHFRIHSPEISNNPLPAANFETRLLVKFDLMARLEPREVRLPIVRREEWKGTVDFSKWESLSTLVTSQALDDREVRLDIRMPKALVQKYPDLLKEIVLVLDVSNSSEVAGELQIPFYLDVKDRGRLDLLEAVQLIEIVGDDKREVKFTPK